MRLELSHVSLIYPGQSAPALNDVSLSFAPESFTAIVGPSGCGKTTLLNTIAGLATASDGTVVRAGRLSMVFQSGALLPWKTAEENISLGLMHLSERERHTKAHEALREVGMQDFARSLPRDLSGGQRQRIGIARAIAVNPDILLLDEPFSALDVETTERLHHELLALWRSRKLTIIMVSHSPEEAALLAQSVVVMRNGRVLKEYPNPLSYPRDLNHETMHFASEIRMRIHTR